LKYLKIEKSFPKSEFGKEEKKIENGFLKSKFGKEEKKIENGFPKSEFGKEKKSEQDTERSGALSVAEMPKCQKQCSLRLRSGN